LRVALVTNGSRGDVEPFLGLGLELVALGHEAVVATQAHFEPLARGRGLGFHPVRGDIQEFTKELLEHGENFGLAMRRAGEMLKDMMREMFEDTLEACREADVVVWSTTGYPGRKVAQYLGVPAVGMAMQPMFYTTGLYPSSVVPEVPPCLLGVPGLGGAYNRASYAATRQLYWQPLRRSLNKAAREVLGMRPEPFLGPFRDLIHSGEPWLNAWSPAVVPPVPGTAPWMHTVGYVIPRDPGPSWRPPDALNDFLESGPAPIYVGFGSMSTRRSERTTEAVLGALRATGSRGILLTGWGGIDNAATSDDVFVLDDAPHAWLFERVSAAVHHGGAGTTAASLTAGLPTVTVPFFADQRFWGRRVAAMGAGPEPIAASGLAAGPLARAIRAAENRGVAARASEIGRALRSEEGPRAAARIIERHASDAKKHLRAA
jgi:sterol 3beta-glucosyltransferase